MAVYVVESRRVFDATKGDLTQALGQVKFKLKAGQNSTLGQDNVTLV
jgi:hypothetical protein